MSCIVSNCCCCGGRVDASKEEGQGFLLLFPFLHTYVVRRVEGLGVAQGSLIHVRPLAKELVTARFSQSHLESPSSLLGLVWCHRDLKGNVEKMKTTIPGDNPPSSFVCVP